MFRRVLFPGFLLVSLASAIAAPPVWWASRGATDANPPNDDAAVNQGQLKQFTQKAVQELNARIPGGAGSELNDLVNGWIQAYQTGGYNAANPLPADFDAMNSGQLKWIANKVHARLVFVKYENAPPAWLVPNPATDKQLVNLGQLKTVFNFDLTAPIGQLPDWWQKFYFNGQTEIDPNGDPDTDGLTNLQELAMVTDPHTIGVDADMDGLPDDWELANAGKFAAYPPQLSASLFRNESSPSPIILKNGTGAAVNYTVALTGNSGPAYSFMDSVAGNLTYAWDEDIKTTGTLLSAISEADDAFEMVSISGFTFPFYGQTFAEIYVNSNGLLTFGAGDVSFSNSVLPSESSPTNLIAALWDDLDTRTTGDIYYKQESDHLVIQYQDVEKFGGTGIYTFQVVLFSDGRIQLRYKTLIGEKNSCTIGTQDSTKAIGLQIAHAATYLQDGMTIEIRPQSDFFIVSPANGSVPANSSQTLAGIFRSSTLPPALYDAAMTLNHSESGSSPLLRPIHLEVNNAPSTIELTSPVTGMSLLEGITVSLTAMVYDLEGISRVEFYENSTKIAETAGNHNFHSIGDFEPGVGTRTLVARVVDIYGAVTDSSPVIVNVTADTDRDGIADAWEIANGLNPLNPDTDEDDLPDGWETANNLNALDDGSINPNNGVDGDPDGDGLSNIFEFWYATNPNIGDTDSDGLVDYDELYIYQTNPGRADSDDDALSDFAEIFTYGTSPYLEDSDDDTLTDGEEVLTHLTNPLAMDSDGDWMWDDWELDHGLNPNSAADGLQDADSDTLANQLEFVFLDQGYDPFVANNAATFPWTGDPDWDGLSTQVEFGTHLTNPMQSDTDDDGFNDSWELANGLNPKLNNSISGLGNHHPDADPDSDGLTNAEEEQLDTNPFLADTDADGFSDFDEERGASNPNDAANTPDYPGGSRYALNSSSSSMGPPSPIARVEFTFGDHSFSHSEKYRVQLTPLEGDGNSQVRSRTNRKYGETESRIFYLPKGAKYKVELIHIGTSPRYRDNPKPDYDYTLQVDESTNFLIVADPQGIMGQNDDSDTFFASGKDVTLHVPLFEWITPKGSPVTQPDDISTGKNEFFYDTSTAGELLINLEVSVKPTGTAGLTGGNGVKFSDRCFFVLPQITGSTFAWDAANVGGKSNADGDNLRAKATYSTLPSLNSEFGLKQAGFICDGNTDALSKGDFEVFFSKDATNHSGGQTGSPNWFHYWKQFLPMGRIATLTYDNTIGDYGQTSSQPRTTFVSKKASETNDETGNKGLHAFFETLVHESFHITLWEGWWGTGPNNFPNGTADTDADNYPDSFETSTAVASYGFTVGGTVDDSFAAGKNTAGHRYEEDKCRAQEHLIPDLSAYDSQDWSFDIPIKGKNQ